MSRTCHPWFFAIFAVALLACKSNGQPKAQSNVRGALVRLGVSKSFKDLTPRFVGVHCVDNALVRLHVELPPDQTHLKIWDPVLRFHLNPLVLETGKKYPPRTLAERDRPLLVLAGTSSRDRIQPGVPENGWVKVHKLVKEGPVHIGFDLDFGEFGRVDGEIVVEKTRGEVCTSPPPPGGP